MCYCRNNKIIAGSAECNKKIGGLGSVQTHSVSCHLESTILLDYSVCDMIWHRGFGLVNQPISNQRPKKKQTGETENKSKEHHKNNVNSSHLECGVAVAKMLSISFSHTTISSENVRKERKYPVSGIFLGENAILKSEKNGLIALN